jgi:hypothetical protein
MRPSRPQPVLDAILEAELVSACETQMSDVGSGVEKLIMDMIEGESFRCDFQWPMAWDRQVEWTLVCPGVDRVRSQDRLRGQLVRTTAGEIDETGDIPQTLIVVARVTDTLSDGSGERR